MMKIITSCLILATFCISSSFSACTIQTKDGLSVSCDSMHMEWTKSEDKAIYWTRDCEFIGHDIAMFNSPDFECGKLCHADKECIHFTWKKGNCYLKDKEPLEKLEDPSRNEEDICGYIPGRD